MASLQKLAEVVGFEPTDPFGSTDFKSAAVNHLTTPLNLELLLGTDPRTKGYKAFVFPVKL